MRKTTKNRPAKLNSAVEHQESTAASPYMPDPFSGSNQCTIGAFAAVIKVGPQPREEKAIHIGRSRQAVGRLAANEWNQVFTAGGAIGMVPKDEPYP